MTRLKLPAHVLALNPHLAAAQAKSRAQTPGGRGHGYTPDAQKYDPATVVPTDRRAMMMHIAKTTLGMMEIWGLQWQDGKEAMALRRAIKDYLRRLEQSS